MAYADRNKKAVLLSLEMAALGYSGIPQDTRLIVRNLLQASGHDYTGLLMEVGHQHTARVMSGWSKAPQLDLMTATNYFLGLTGFEPPRNISHMGRVMRRLWLLHRVYVRARTGFSLGAIPDDAFAETAWRLLFRRSLRAEDRDLVARLRLMASTLLTVDFHRQYRFPFAPACTLDTSAFDAIIFSDVRPINVHKDTTKIVRYHDAIPLTDPDLLGDGAYSTYHYNFLKHCVGDSWFVCNSEATRANLLRLFPEIERHCRVIPCIIDASPDDVGFEISPRDIIQRRASKSKEDELAAAPLGAAAAGWPGLRDPLETADGETSFDYILAVSALEPKKNVRGIITAYERLCAKTPAPPKLVLVGKPSWAYDQDLAALKPHIKRGSAFHLIDVPPHELKALYKGARLLCFPSFAEGFGYPPLEALSAGTPSVVSDIPALRETLGAAALYVDPYDPVSISDAMLRLLDPQTGPALVADLVSQRDARLAPFDGARVAAQWEELIATASPRERSRTS
jgi:glycosyltransferase involved in cell wall biosynthesis